MASLHLVSGWATEGAYLQPLAQALGGDGAPGLTSVHDWVGGEALEGSGQPFGRTPTTLVGWSMGGQVCLQLARRFPRAVEAIILLSTTARFCRTAGYRCGQPPSVLQNLEQQLRTDATAALTGFFLQAAHPQTPAPEELATRVVTARRVGHTALRAALDRLAAWDLREELADIRQPTLVLHGAQDRIIPSNAGQWLSRRLPQAEWECFADAGHDLPVLQTERTAVRIRAFLAGHAIGSAAS